MPERHLSRLSEAEVGRTYLAARVGGEVVLVPTEPRGRPRGLTEAQAVAARALRALPDFSQARIAELLGVGLMPVRTALGER